MGTPALPPWWVWWPAHLIPGLLPLDSQYHQSPWPQAGVWQVRLWRSVQVVSETTCSQLMGAAGVLLDRSPRRGGPWCESLTTVYPEPGKCKCSIKVC